MSSISARSALKRKESDSSRDISPPPVKRISTPGTNQNAINNFFAPSSKKAPENVTWTIRYDSLIVGRYHETPQKTLPQVEVPRKRRIAAFDFDSTLIATKSGNMHPKDAQDWRWWHHSVPSRLKRLHDDGVIVTIFSNQGGITLKEAAKPVKADKNRLVNFKQKAATVFSQLGIPITLYAATAKDPYRKPRIGMYTEFLKDHGFTVDDVDLTESIFVGDAAGRTADKIHKKDFSCGDRNFASNIGIPFQTPEEFFLQEAPRPWERDFDPAQYILSPTSVPAVPIFQRNHDWELVIFVGPPGSGKSSFYQRHLAPLGYMRVNQDTLGSRDKCVKVARAYLEDRKSVAVDNTNRDRSVRNVWVELARTFNVPIRCVQFTASAELAKHNDTVRALNGVNFNPEKRTMLPGIALPSYAKAFEAPSLKEGFEDITSVDFVFEGTEEDRRIWSMYWI